MVQQTSSKNYNKQTQEKHEQTNTGKKTTSMNSTTKQTKQNILQPVLDQATPTTSKQPTPHLSTSFFAKPKSVILMCPVLSNRMFSGFRSLDERKEPKGRREDHVTGIITYIAYVCSTVERNTVEPPIEDTLEISS